MPSIVYSKRVSSTRVCVLPEGVNTSSVVPVEDGSVSVSLNDIGRANAVLLTVHGITAAGAVPNVWVTLGPAGTVATKGFRISDGNWDQTNLRLTSDAGTPFADYTFAAGDLFLLSSGTDTEEKGVYLITAKNSDSAIDLQSTIADPAGDLSNADIVGQILPRRAIMVTPFDRTFVQLRSGETLLTAMAETTVAGALLFVTPLIVIDS